MTAIGTPLTSTATRVLFCGAGELAKEVIIELQRLGVEVIAVDRYPNAPGMQVAHRSHVIDMLDGFALRNIIEQEKPHYIVPEIEAIATEEHGEGESGQKASARVQPMGCSPGPAAGRKKESRLAASVITCPCGHAPPQSQSA